MCCLLSLKFHRYCWFVLLFWTPKFKVSFQVVNSIAFIQLDFVFSYLSKVPTQSAAMFCLLGRTICIVLSLHHGGGNVWKRRWCCGLHVQSFSTSSVHCVNPANPFSTCCIFSIALFSPSSNQAVLPV